MKKYLIALTLISSLFTSSANAEAIATLHVTAGDFFMGEVQADPVLDGINEFAGDLAMDTAGVLLPAAFNFAGFFGLVDLGADGDGLHGDDTTTLDLSNFAIDWSGNHVAQAPNTGTQITTFGPGNTFTVYWIADVLTGPFAGQIGTWTMEGTYTLATVDPVAPVFDSTPPSTKEENVTGTIYTANANDADGDNVSYSLSGADNILFNIDSSSGYLSFVTPPDFENQADDGGDNVYNVTITATDDSASELTATQDLVITVTDVNDQAPVFANPTAIASLTEGLAATGYTASAIDTDTVGSITYTISGGADGLKFNIDAAGGALSFKVAPDFEANASAAANNDYVVIVQADDGVNATTTQTVTVTVTDANEFSPVFISDSAISMDENQTSTGYTAAATDDDTAQTVSYSIAGGADELKFNIAGGALSFKLPPDFEANASAAGNNLYVVIIEATDNHISPNTTQITVNVTVTDLVTENLIINSSPTANFAENTVGTVYTATAIGPNDPSTFALIGGTDQDLFTLAPGGALTFKTAPDFEIKGDANGDNIYNIDIQATDANLDTADLSVAITVTDANDLAPTFVSPTATASLTEGLTATGYTAVATDGDSVGTITYTLSGGADELKFNITAGALSFQDAPDFEANASAAGDNDYVVIVQADDGVNASTTQTVTVTVNDANDQAPTFVSPTATASLTEGLTATGYTAIAIDTDTVGSITYTISGGADGLKFNIDAGGALSFKVAPDFEANASAAANNDYVVIVQANDGINATATQTVTITVLDAAPTPPAITLNGEAILSINPGITYSDAGATAVDDVDGDISAKIVTVNPVPDPTIPGDYVVTYNVSDAENDAATEVTRTVTVTNVPRIFVSGAAIINLNEGASYTEQGATATDVEDENSTLVIFTTGTVDTSTVATYTVTYSVTDSDGNEAFATRTINVLGSAGTVLGISSLTIDGGDFSMGSGGVITAGDITPFTMGVYQGSAPAVKGTEASYKPTSLATFLFGQSGPVAVYTADTDGINSGFALPSGSVNTVNSSITLTMPSWIAYWNENSFAMGATSTDDNYTPLDATGIFNATTNEYDVSWQSQVNGGPFGGQIASWHITGTAELLTSDSVAPEIVITGDDQVRQLGEAYAELGVDSVTDNIDGALDPALVTISGGVDVNTVGTYTITYSIADSSSNVGVTTRTVLVVDGNQPVISPIGDNVINVAWNDTYVDAGATAVDIEDDDLTLTANIVVAGESIDTSVLGTYFVTYNVSDSNGNPAFEVTRVVNVVDLVAPVINLIGSPVVYLQQGDVYDDKGAEATDDIDTNPGITNRIATVQPVDTAVEGTYIVSYDVTDNAGNIATTVTRTVYVDFTGPEVSIAGSGSVAINVGGTFVDEGATATDTVSGDLTVTPDCSAVDTSTAGSYSCTYTATDDAGNVTTSTRTVTVIVPTFVVENVPLQLSIMQNGIATSVVTTKGGSVVVTTSLPVDGSDILDWDWSATDNNLVPVDSIYDASAFTFDPSDNSDGVYQLTVTTNAGIDDEVISSRLLLIASTLPILSSVDTDGDGINDDIEGLGDADADGVPNYLDDSNDPANAVKVTGSSSVVSNAGALSLGTTAFSSADVATGDFSALIDIDDIVSHGGDAGTIAPPNAGDPTATDLCVGGCFDFEVTDVDPGASVQVVLPLAAEITTNVVYRKYTTELGWTDFDTSGNDEIASSGLVNGTCPAPNTVDRWIDGLFPGDVCIRLTIQDGGSNDADGVANGVIQDPGGIQALPAPAEINRDFSGNGCSAASEPVNPLDRGDWMIVAGFITWMGMLTYRRRKSSTRA